MNEPALLLKYRIHGVELENNPDTDSIEMNLLTYRPTPIWIFTDIQHGQEEMEYGMLTRNLLAGSDDVLYYRMPVTSGTVRVAVIHAPLLIIDRSKRVCWDIHVNDDIRRYLVKHTRKALEDYERGRWNSVVAIKPDEIPDKISVIGNYRTGYDWYRISLDAEQEDQARCQRPLAN